MGVDQLLFRSCGVGPHTENFGRYAAALQVEHRAYPHCFVTTRGAVVTEAAHKRVARFKCVPRGRDREATDIMRRIQARSARRAGGRQLIAPDSDQAEKVE